VGWVTWLRRFHHQVFLDGGVDPSKLVVVPEPVDVDFFNPATATELPLSGSYSEWL